MTDETCKSLLGTEVREGLYMMGKIDGMGVGWVDIAHGGKSLLIALSDKHIYDNFGRKKIGKNYVKKNAGKKLENKN